ncbi:MAG: L-seryl-tRNA(Sec) selenium transferase [Actinomycetota bacterium]|nr:L-seryl-tRNA(Sec) selenium transferase [Actinomycetota bacterium]
MSEALRGLPAVERVRAALGEAYPHALAVTAARAAVEAARRLVEGGGAVPPFEEIVSDARRRLTADDQRGLQGVVNATGVLIHTNLGRAPLGGAQLDAVARVAGGYSNVEYDLVAGRRGSRYEHARRLLCAATGAESALVVNNNAAALLVTLAALCADKEVVVSRGELIEIGGEFRIPDVLTASGARLVEVGTTNRTHVADYERAITPETGALLKVHPSNYEVVGFTASVAARDVARLARGRAVCFIHDLGSGVLSGDVPWAPDDPAADVALEDGADVVTFSCDKLLGGPQAGVIAGRRELIDRIARHPLLRAVRVDKMTLAALEATLSLYIYGRVDEIPLYALANAPLAALEARSHAIAIEIEALAKVEVVATSATPGGGSAPGKTLPSCAVAITHPERSADEIAARLRTAAPPVVGRIEDDRVVLDLRAVFPEQDAAIVAALRSALA